MRQEKRYQKIKSINKNGKFIGIGVKSEERIKPKGRPIILSHQLPEHELLKIETPIPTTNNTIVKTIFLQSIFKNSFQFTIKLSLLRTKIYLFQLR